MNRRGFFGHLGVIIAASAAPTIFIPKTPVHWGKPVLFVPKTYKTKAIWHEELLQDLQAYHNINAEAEMNALLREYVQQQFPNREIVSITKSEVYRDVMYGCHRRHVYATIMEPVV